MQRSDRRASFNAYHWAAFAGLGPRTAFLGLYRARLIERSVTGLTDPLTGRSIADPHDLYTCELLEDLAPYGRRIYINWGNPRPWNQRGTTFKEVVEIRATYQEPAFPGLLAFRAQLTEIATMPESWRQRLQEARGIYRLACPVSREHYVGQVGGAGGFLGRWLEYAVNGHGGNVQLRHRNRSDYQVSILEVAGSAASDQDLHDMETRWKQKLLSREMGLNSN